MTGLILTGALLVLTTWVVAVFAVISLGLLPACLTQREASRSVTLRSALWWGLGVAVAIILTMSLLLPLRSGSAAVIFIALLLLLGVPGWLLFYRSGKAQTSSRTAPIRDRRLFAWLVLGAIGIVSAYLALKALGPVTNYDSGLYHLNAIRYAGDFATVPGLANIFNAFGYDNSAFPLSAFLGNGPWDGVGYRLFNGLILFAAAIDLVLRLAARRYTWGTFVLFIGVGVLWIPMIAIADFWVTSPTSDSAIMVLTLVTTAYLADFLSDPDGRASSWPIVAVLSLVMMSMRPTTVFFAITAIGVLVVIALVGRRRAPTRLNMLAASTVLALGLIIGLVQVLRDMRLSGWLMYPLSVFAFDVPWLTDNPAMLRAATLGNARDPSDLWNAASNWAWIAPWFDRLWSQWEIYLLLALVITSGIAVLLMTRVARVCVNARLVAVCQIPGLVAVITWFTLSPPSFRFIWGPLFTIALLPLAAALYALSENTGRLTRPWNLAYPLTAAGVVGILLCVTGYSAVFRNQAAQITESRTWSIGTLQLNYALAPIPKPKTNPVTLDSGLTVDITVETEQCWDTFPLCTPRIEPTIAMLGDSIQNGFTR